MSGSGLGPASQLVPHCSCRSKLSSLESQAIRTPSNATASPPFYSTLSTSSSLHRKQPPTTFLKQYLLK
ncbi:hypothetical protein V6N11_071872 [Hibiscus sabdariffa]|uniref:Uncharacterized protein n=1 Tax=Hibiscus sabdariffa TaxID=183260 RepID=A0ABR2U1Y9_9ROSI